MSHSDTKSPSVTPELLCVITQFCDVDTLVRIACLASRTSAIATHELNGRCTHDTTVKQVLNAAVQDVSLEDVHVYRRHLYKRLRLKVDRWGTVKGLPNEMLNKMLADRVVDSYRVSQDLFSQITKPDDFSITCKDIRRLPCQLLYRIWEAPFLDSSLDAASSQEGFWHEIKTKQATGRRLLTLLTDEVMTIFRHDLVVNDRFIVKCFEHGLDSVLLYLFENRQFFTLDITTPNLQDLYIMLACDTASPGMFLRFLPHIQRPHLEYALQNATSDFLMIIWKSRKYVPNFNEHMLAIRLDSERSMTSRDFKQRRFLEWCAEHP